MPRAIAASLALLLSLTLAARTVKAAASPDSVQEHVSRPSVGAGPTFAVLAYDSASGSWGVACAASEIACGARIPAAAAGVGAIASLGMGSSAMQAALAALAANSGPDSALAVLKAAGEDPNARQVLVVSRDGRAGGASGSRLPGFSGLRVQHGHGCAGFGLRSEATLAAMEEALQGGSGEIGSRLLEALQAGERAEVIPFGRHGGASAAMLVVRAGADGASGSDRLVDLRVDEGEDPIGALARLYQRHAETFLPAAHVRFGDAARRRGDDAAAAREYHAAEAGFRGAVARTPKDADALNELAWFLATRGGDPVEALRFAEAAVLARRDDPNLLDTLAEAAYRAGNLERAIDAAERAERFARGNARYEERLRAFRAAKAALVPASR